MTRQGRDTSRRAAFLPDDDDMMREILLRLPPRPSSLASASAVCKRWRRLVTAPGFLRQLYAHHGKPPLLGFFVCRDEEIVFNPAMDPPDRIPPQRFSLGRCTSLVDYDLLDCRHGLVLIKNRSRTEVLVCHPITGEQRSVAIPPEFKSHFFNGSVLCAAGHQGHVGHHSSQFKVVFMSMYRKDNQLVRVYSSKTGTWGDLIATEAPCEISDKPAVLIGNCLYWTTGDHILEFELDRQKLDVIMGPPVTNDIPNRNRQIIRAADDAVGYAILSYPGFQMWQRNINTHGVATWVLWKTIELQKIIWVPSPHEDDVELLGYDEDDVVFFCYGVFVYMVQLKSMRFRKLIQTRSTGNRYFPFKTFFKPGPTIAGGFNGAQMLHKG